MRKAVRRGSGAVGVRKRRQDRRQRQDSDGLLISLRPGVSTSLTGRYRRQACCRHDRRAGEILLAN